MASIISYTTAQVVRCDQRQYDFAMYVESLGDIDQAAAKMHATAEELSAWEADPVYWECITGRAKQTMMARMACEDWLKARLAAQVLQTSPENTKSQARAIDQMIKILNRRVDTRTAKVTSEEGKLTVEFNESVMPATPVQQEQDEDED